MQNGNDTMPLAARQHASRSSRRWEGQRHWWLLLAAIMLAACSRACTVFQLQNDAFASNMLYLMRAIPIYYKQNGAPACERRRLLHAGG